ncbi:plasmid partitioning protein RepB [Rhizobium tubonense]|uniref:Plasmid partitioning protein RepB n=1 Tax=Rhizobium tubonense TaxID=484088 RepID=A0A2W4CK07_9HYPH|nr:plasmid partitioning protein RepB [Rhizobium tubonense]PZM13212.1 plasmid partitioning protein RepB [Rhizobium tubonense]
MSRKNLFADLPAPVTTSGAPPHERPLHGTSNPMSAIKKSVGDLNDRSRRADEIEKSLIEGQPVIDIDTALIDPSFVQDRMESDIHGLRASIQEQGQQVPILVRLHPDDDGRYQVAFGHRRLRALKELGLKAKAIVRSLTDEQLVIAQGQENNEREDLTFIEKARFAARLKERFTRDVIVSSLSVDKTTLSTMLQLVDALPEDLIEAIGPAPGVGRPSWRQLADLLEKTKGTSEVIAVAKAESTQALSSEERFKAVMSHMRPKPVSRGAPTVLATPTGARLGQITQNKTKLEITVDKKATPDFATFLLEQVPALYEAYLANHRRN